MSSIIVLINIIPALFIILLIIKTVVDALKNECYYFVSYHWTSMEESGHGTMEVMLHGSSVDSYDDILEMKTHIEDLKKDTHGNSIQVIILNFVKLNKSSKHGKDLHIVFTDETVFIKNSTKNYEKK